MSQVDAGSPKPSEIKILREIDLLEESILEKRRPFFRTAKFWLEVAAVFLALGGYVIAAGTFLRDAEIAKLEAAKLRKEVGEKQREVGESTAMAAGEKSRREAAESRADAAEDEQKVTALRLATAETASVRFEAQADAAMEHKKVVAELLETARNDTADYRAAAENGRAQYDSMLAESRSTERELRELRDRVGRAEKLERALNDIRKLRLSDARLKGILDRAP